MKSASRRRTGVVVFLDPWTSGIWWGSRGAGSRGVPCACSGVSEI